jgi:hypothetical protein
MQPKKDQLLVIEAAGTSRCRRFCFHVIWNTGDLGYFCKDREAKSAFIFYSGLWSEHGSQN